MSKKTSLLLTSLTLFLSGAALSSVACSAESPSVPEEPPLGGSGPVIVGSSPDDEDEEPRPIDPENPWLGSGGSNGGTGGTSTGTGSTSGSGGALGGSGPDVDPPEPALVRLVGYDEKATAEKRLTVEHVGGDAIAILGCEIEVYANGKTDPYRRIPIAGLSAGGELELCTTIELPLTCSPLLGYAPFNGDDALVVRCSGIVTDSFGRVGEDPGNAWIEEGVSSKDQTLVRCGEARDTDPFDAFSIAREWVALGEGETREAAELRCPDLGAGGADAL